MKNFLIAVIFLFTISSCGDKKSNTYKTSDTYKTRLPPPVVKADAEVAEEAPPAVSELEVADPGVKSIKGDPNADITINESVGNADAKAFVSEDNNSPVKPVADTEKKIIKDGDISFETDNINSTRAKILNSLKKLGGYVVEDKEATGNEENRKDYTLNTRIPAKNFDMLLNFVSSTADKIDSKNISITDVTTKFIDVSTRLGNKKLLETRYLDLLKKASKISDLLEIENKLTEIRSDIESTQGQLNYLNKQVAYSSLSITFYTKQVEKIDKPKGFGYKLKRALGKGWVFLQNLFYKVISLWPLWLLIIVLFLVFKAWRRKRRLVNPQE